MKKFSEAVKCNSTAQRVEEDVCVCSRVWQCVVGSAKHSRAWCGKVQLFNDVYVCMYVCMYVCIYA